MQVRIEGKCTDHVAKEFGPFKWLMQRHTNDMSRFLSKCPACRNIKWSFCNETCVSSKNTTITTRNEGYPFKFIRKQFPIRLCFAMTINKAQGQTIHNVGLYLPQHVFSNGQLYVALSRGISMFTTKVLGLTE